METRVKNNRRKLIEMDFIHQEMKLTTQHFYGRGVTMKTLQSSIRKDGCREPTAPEVVSFVHEYFNNENPEAQKILRAFHKFSLSTFTGILCIPREKVVHFIDYPEFDSDGLVDTKNLLERIDESRAQVSFEYFKEGPVNWRKIATHPYFIAWAGGKEGAEKLSEIALKFPIQEAYILTPHIRTGFFESTPITEFTDFKEPLSRLADLGGYNSWNCRLRVNSSIFGDIKYHNTTFGISTKI